MTEVVVPEDRRYTKDHEWAKPDGQAVVIGITAFAVDQLGDVTLVSIDVKEGDQVTKGKIFGTIESVKTLSDLYAPVSGKVVRRNASLEDQPELVNEDPWDKGWMIAIEPSDDGADLLDAAAYRAHVAESAH
ncbi:MAG: glycine cleavage system protein H [Sorangiineae bacterium NIC37A_2]|jgi:glycine cleavage system H protein|nr:MAG: glycine cleavage system protein H [Sorangiineae bacterium NIC37A_2]